MNVDILFGEAGAREAARRESVTVVIDALRASATATTALALGARKVIPAGTVAEARQFLGRNGHLVAGERQGIKLPDFDFGNSPTELHRDRHRLTGQTLVLTTSNGTRIVRAADGAAVILMGTTINAEATADIAYECARRYDGHITLLATGENEDHAEEDYVGARRIAYYLQQLGATVRSEDCIEEDAPAIFASTYSAQVLYELGYDEDVEYCARSNVYDVVPLLENGAFVASQPARMRPQTA